MNSQTRGGKMAKYYLTRLEFRMCNCSFYSRRDLRHVIFI